MYVRRYSGNESLLIAIGVEPNMDMNKQTLGHAYLGSLVMHVNLNTMLSDCVQQVFWLWSPCHVRGHKGEPGWALQDFMR